MSQISPLVPSLVFRDDAEHRLQYSYIGPIVRSFFEVRDMGIPREIPASVAITEFDFEQSGDLPFSYFYDIVMKGVKKVNGSISHCAYTLTFDPDLCPLRCEKTGIRYGHLSLAGRPVLYYLLLDLPTLINKLRQHTDLKPEYGTFG